MVPESRMVDSIWLVIQVMSSSFGNDSLTSSSTTAHDQSRVWEDEAASADVSVEEAEGAGVALDSVAAADTSFHLPPQSPPCSLRSPLQGAFPSIPPPACMQCLISCVNNRGSPMHTGFSQDTPLGFCLWMRTPVAAFVLCSV